MGYSEDEVIEFTATITYTKYYNKDTFWGTYQFTTLDDIPRYKPYGKDMLLKESSLVGKMQELVEGGEYRIKAVHKVHKVYGDQYEPISVYALIPQTEESQRLFLESILTERQAENLLKAYPNIVNDVAIGKVAEIDYSKVKGVGKITWMRIRDKIVDNYVLSDIIALLTPIGVTYNMIKKLIKFERNPSLLKDKIMKEPYVLLNIDGLSFKTVDKMAIEINQEFTCSIERLEAFSKYFFKSLGDNKGYTWTTKRVFNNAVINNVNECSPLIEKMYEESGILHHDEKRVGLQYYYDIERKIFDIILRKMDIDTSDTFSRLVDENINKALKEAEAEQGFEFTLEQIIEIKKMVNRTVSLLTGSAGTGKSSIMRGAVKIYSTCEYEVVSSALSAMASQRISEATGHVASTIHRTLGCHGEDDFDFNEENPLIADVAFIDEASMVNAKLFLDWLLAIPKQTRIILAGDHKQLPPIGFGNIFSDLLDLLADSGCVSKLTKVLRQAEDSGITVDANKIRENINPITDGVQPKIVHGNNQDMYYMFRNDRNTLFNIAMKTYLKSVSGEGIDNVVIITPRKQGCTNCSDTFNSAIQDTLLGDVWEKIEYGDNKVFKLGARVLQVANNYDKNVFNGELGYITEIGQDENDKGKMEEYCACEYADLLTGGIKQVRYFKSELDQLELGYALTCHKIQGGARKTCIIVIDTSHTIMLDNCILYTMITRAKKRCCVLAEPQAFATCIHTSHNIRQTWLQLEYRKNKKELVV